MIPASCAVARASPFGSSASFEAVSGAIRTTARARARRRDTGLSPTSTMRTAPLSSTCERSLTSGTLSLRDARDAAVEVGELPLDPGRDVVLAHVSTDGLEALPPLRLRHRKCAAQRLRLVGDVERVHAHDPLAELLVRPGVLGQDHHAVALVHERRLLGHEVHAVED